MEREGGGGIEGERMGYGGGDGERERESKINFAMCIDMYHSIVRCTCMYMYIYTCIDTCTYT